MKNYPRESSVTRTIERLVSTRPVTDIHTHLFDPAFGGLCLWGIDELLVYHYLIAEFFRQHPIPPEKFWRLSREEQAELIWQNLFLEHSPISEACRGVLTTLNELGIDAKKRDLKAIRRWFSRQKLSRHIDRCMEAGGVESICMTNSPFDDAERSVWEQGFSRDPRFTTALRIDPLINDWPGAARKLREWGYDVRQRVDAKTASGVRRFLADWTKKIDPLYVMASTEPRFRYPDSSAESAILEKALLPHCREMNLPLALMPGVQRAVNPALRLAGDGVGRAEMESYERLIASAPDNRFLLTVLSRENQHQLCVMARKFANLHIFGCWWFLNNPSLVEETTRMRIEMLGLSVTLQHSDARVLEQIVYKWKHSREVIARVLKEKYADLERTGWRPTAAEMQRDVDELFGGAFQTFLKR